MNSETDMTQCPLRPVCVEWPSDMLSPVRSAKDDESSGKSVVGSPKIHSKRPGNLHRLGSVHVVDQDSEPPKAEESKESEDPSSSESANAQWQRAHKILSKYPSLMTPKIFCMALQNNPPLEMVQSMLRMNPNAANIPPSGATALQVALEYKCSMEVIECLIEACPMALVTRNPGSRHLDPLSYAKRFRADEPLLIELLNKPVSNWLLHSDREQNKLAFEPRLQIDNTKPVFWMAEAKPVSVRPASSVRLSNASDVFSSIEASENNGSLDSVDRKEMENVKSLCLALLKMHQRLSQSLNNDRQQCEDSGAGVDHESVRTEIETYQKKHFRLCLMALEMKERSINAHVRRMERQMWQKFEQARLNEMREAEYKQQQQQQQQSPVVLFSDMQNAVRTVHSRCEVLDRRLVKAEHELVEWRLGLKVPGVVPRPQYPPVGHLEVSSGDSEKQTKREKKKSSKKETKAWFRPVKISQPKKSEKCDISPVFFSTVPTDPTVTEDDEYSDIRSLISDEPIMARAPGQTFCIIAALLPNLVQRRNRQMTTMHPLGSRQAKKIW